jgi:ribosomal protein L34
MENHRKSKIKKLRKSGFRARMRTKDGRKILSRRRRFRAEAKRRKKR